MAYKYRLAQYYLIAVNPENTWFESALLPWREFMKLVYDKIRCCILGDSFTIHNGYNFSTSDHDNDVYGDACAVKFLT